MSNLRLLRIDLVYIIGLKKEIANEEVLKFIKTLRSYEYLGQYGKILKIIINDQKVYHPKNVEPQFSAYITFEKNEDAALAVLGLFEFNYIGQIVRCSYGSTKYCLFYLKGKNCLNKECLFMHE